MDAYKRWRNCQDPGITMFVTTTCLGWVPALRTDEARAILLAQLVHECRRLRARLHAYCIMEHHLHLVIAAPTGMTMSRFMQTFKEGAAKRVLEAAHPFIRGRLMEEAKDGRSLWMRSFRGVPLRSERTRWACIRYTHLNPVRAGLCERPEEHTWSSARLYETCRWIDEIGVLPALLEDGWPSKAEDGCPPHH